MAVPHDRDRRVKPGDDGVGVDLGGKAPPILIERFSPRFRMFPQVIAYKNNS
jgi:hypothetical protein